MCFFWGKLNCGESDWEVPLLILCIKWKLKSLETDSFPSEGSLFWQSHFVGCKIIIYYAQIKIRSYMIQAIKREMIFNKVQRLMCLHSGVSIPSTVSISHGKARPWALGFRAGQMLLKLLHSALCSAPLQQKLVPATCKCIPPGAGPHPVHLHKQFQLSNMSGNSSLRVPLQLLGNRKVWHRNNCWLSANIEVRTALNQLKQEHQQHP